MLKVFFKRSFFLFGLLLFFCSVKVSAQQYGVVEEHKSPLIERLQKERSLIARGGMLGNTASASEKKEGVPLKTGRKVTARGYRVQIYSGSDRSGAYAAQAKFKEIYKDLNTYLSYEQPNYRVKVGDFTNRSQALSLMNQLKQQFNSVFIFTEMINLEI